MNNLTLVSKVRETRGRLPDSHLSKVREGGSVM